ncbi:MAG: hypothetical protein ACRDH0_06405 [Actinomycetota bacterium]
MPTPAANATVPQPPHEATISRNLAPSNVGPGTNLYLSLQDREDPTRFLHVMIFDDDAAEDFTRTRMP